MFRIRIMDRRIGNERESWDIINREERREEKVEGLGGYIIRRGIYRIGNGE